MHLWGSKSHAVYSITLCFYPGWSAYLGTMSKIRVWPYYNEYMTGGGSFLGGTWEWFQRSYIIFTPCLWLLDCSKPPRTGLLKLRYTLIFHNLAEYAKMSRKIQQKYRSTPALIGNNPSHTPQIQMKFPPSYGMSVESVRRFSRLWQSCRVKSIK